MATGPQVSDEPVGARVSGSPPEVPLEVTVTDIGVWDDLTLARVSARICALRTSDESEMGARTFIEQPPVRQYWQLGLALIELSKAFTGSLAWTPDSETSRAPGSEGGPRPVHETSVAEEETGDVERLSEAR